MYFRFPLAVLVTLFLVSCGGGSGTNVKLEVSHNFQFAGSAALQAISGGGLMVWGKNSNGDSFAQSVEGSDSINLNLSNGTWTFYAMAWDGSKDFNGAGMSPGTYYPLGGIQRCGVSSPVTLNGEAVAIDLSISNSSCTDTAFKGSLNTTTDGSGNVVLPNTTFSFCRGISQLTNAQDVCADAQKDIRQKERKAWIGSFKVKLKSYQNLLGSKSINGEIASKCQAMEGDIEIPPSPAPAPNSSHSSMYGASGRKISGLPAGGPGMPFFIEVEMFPGNSNCDDVAMGAVGLRGSLSKHLINGVATDQIGSHKYFPQTNVSNIQLHKLNLQVTNETICTGRNSTGLDAHPFAAGEGTKENPYLICSVPQFHAINSNSGSYLDEKHFRLASNLDFNPYSKGLAGTGVVPSEFGCLEAGSNFIPIGYASPVCTPGNPLVFGTITGFTGSFMGSGYKISNLRLRAEDQDFIGMFAKVETGTTSAPNDFGDLIIESAEISGNSKVGSMVAEMYPTSPGDAKFWKIFAKNLDIEARDRSSSATVGSLFGFFQNGTLETVIVGKSEVRGENHYVGGVVGMLVNSTVAEISADVNIDADSSILISGIGGIAGDVTGSSLNYVKHEGGIYANGWFMGGIAGNVNSGSVLQNFYAISYIYSSSGNSSLKLGGIVGKWDSTGNFGPGYSLSYVKSNCSTTCEMGSLIGTATNTSASVVYKMNPVETGSNGGALMNNETIAGSGEISSMRTIANLSSLPDSGTTDWKKVNNEYPRFDFENHPCTNGLSGTGSGTVLYPFIICHEGQYSTLGSASAGTYHRLGGNIRLSNNKITSTDISTFLAHLNGANFSVLGGYSNVSGGINTGHFGTIETSATLKNINYFGISRYSSGGSLLTHAHGVLAATNKGIIENVRIWSFGNFTKYGSLVVGKNSSGAILRNVELSGELKANYVGSASLAVENAGIIEDSKTENSIICNEGVGCDEVAGLVVVNSGSIYRTEMGTHAREGMSNPFTNDISMLVDTNSGTIQDVLIRDYTDFRVSNGGNYFHRVNSGTLNRVYHSGRLLDPDMNWGGLSIGFPTEITANDPDTGTHTDVLRTGGRSGQELLEEANYTCSGPDVLTVSAWSGISDYFNWNSNFASTGYSNDGKKLFAYVDSDNGPKLVLRILTYNGSNSFGVATGGCPSGTSGKVSLYYTNDMATDLSNAPAAGVKLPQSVYSSYSTNWRSVMWDQTNPLHVADIMNYYAYILGISSTPVTKKTWVYEDDGMLELFDKD